MFCKDIDIGRYRVVFRLDKPTVKTGDGALFFGYPLISSSEDMTKEYIRSRIDKIEGYFLYLGIEKDRIVIANDIAGGYRLYCFQKDRTIYVSDDAEYIIRTAADYEKPALNNHEYRYWQKHGYTTGASTFFAGVKKLPPATIMEISSNGIDRRCYFRDLEPAPDKRRHCDSCLKNLRHTISEAVKESGDIVLFFSGGIDSTLLALLFKEAGADFRLLFAASNPFYRDNYESLHRAVATADYLGLGLETIRIDIDRAFGDFETITRRMPFDRHFAVLHFETAREIARRYGKKVTIVNGQGADSILSFGPTRISRGDFAARTLLYRSSGLMSGPAAAMVRKKHGRQYRLPRDDREFLLAFFDQTGYYTMLDTNASGEYREYLQALIDNIAARFENREALMMYLKIYSFLQGSDNRVVIESARAAGIEKVVMPYVTPPFIYDTVRYRDARYDLLHPKYAIKNGLRSLGASLPKPKVAFDRIKMVELKKITERADKLSGEYVAKLAGTGHRDSCRTGDKVA